MSQYPNSGAFFKNTRATNPKAPQWEGDIEMDADVLRALVANAKAGKPIKLRLAGWVKETKNGDEFISMKGSIPQEKKVEEKKASSFDDDEIPF
jgi:hypothetical protein